MAYPTATCRVRGHVSKWAQRHRLAFVRSQSPQMSTAPKSRWIIMYIVRTVAIWYFFACVAAVGSPIRGEARRDVPLVYMRKEDLTAQQLWRCEYRPPSRFDSARVIAHLYGDKFNVHTSGKGAIFVFGNHNTGTSMLARLLMLMGAFQGNLARLSTSARNRLKYWEMLDVSHFHEMLLSKMTNPRFKPFHAQNFNISQWTGEAQHALDCFIGKVYQDLGRHRPWVIKDPRMVLFAHHWVKQAEDAICVIAYRDPLENAISLARNVKKSAGDDHHNAMSVERWLVTWEQGLLSTLYACKGRPSFVIDAAEMQRAPQRFIIRVHELLQAAGVTGLQLPSLHRVQREFLDFVKPSHRRGSVSNDTAQLTASQDLLAKALHAAMLDASHQSGRHVAVPHAADFVLEMLQRNGHANLVEFKLWGMPM